MKRLRSRPVIWRSWTTSSPPWRPSSQEPATPGVALQLSTLVDRGVPVRAVEVAPGLQAIRLRFADGTAVLVRGWVPGDAGLLARWVRACSVVPVACSVRARGTQLEFSVEGQPNRLALRVTGLDQPG